MKTALLVFFVATAAVAATCPTDVPVVNLLPHTSNGFSWTAAIRPMGDPCISHIALDPSAEGTWFAGSPTGLYMTKNAGQLWTKPLLGNVGALVTAKPQADLPLLVYVGIGTRLYHSRDNGTNWTLLKTFPHAISSLLVSGGKLYVGQAWQDHVEPSGVFIGTYAAIGALKPFGNNITGMIVWSIGRDPNSGAIFAGGEIFDHPTPKAPLPRSLDNGATWTNVAGTIPIHVVSIQVRPTDGMVWALTEGQGVFRSTNLGATWTQQLNAASAPSGTLLLDPKTPTRLFGGRQKAEFSNGGFYFSTDEGKTFTAAGLSGVTVAGLAVSGPGTKIFAAAYGSGIHVAAVP